MTDHHEDIMKDDDTNTCEKIVLYAYSNGMYEEAIAVCDIFNKKWQHRTDIFKDWKEQIIKNRE